MKQTASKQHSFTVIELLVAITIIGLLASIVLVNLKGAKEQARIARVLEWDHGIRSVLGSNAVGAWSFDEGSLSTAYDSSGNGNDGTLKPSCPGCPTWVKSGAAGGALSFDGSNDYVDCGHISLEGNQVTVSWWMNVTDNSGLAQSDNFAPVIIDWMKGGGSDYRDGTLLCYIKTNPNWSGGNYATNGVVCTYSSSDTQLNDVGTSFNDWYGSWHNIAYSVEGTAAKIYVDGKLEKSIVGAGDISPENEIFAINRRAWNYGVNLHGLVDEVRIYKEALPVQAIREHYLSGLEEHRG